MGLAMKTALRKVPGHVKSTGSTRHYVEVVLKTRPSLAAFPLSSTLSTKRLVLLTKTPMHASEIHAEHMLGSSASLFASMDYHTFQDPLRKGSTAPALVAVLVDTHEFPPRTIVMAWPCRRQCRYDDEQCKHGAYATNAERNGGLRVHRVNAGRRRDAKRNWRAELTQLRVPVQTPPAERRICMQRGRFLWTQYGAPFTAQLPEPEASRLQRAIC